jgi:hypothetical protein
MTISPNRPSTKRGRPLVTDGRYRCSDATGWPTSAGRRGRARVLQLLLHRDAHPRSVSPLRSRRCASRPRPRRWQSADLPVVRGISADFTCQRCGTEDDLYRRGTCARCALRDDLTVLMIDGAHDPEAMAPIVDALCRVDRPASILTWKLSRRVQALLAGLASDIPLTHQGLDEAA